MKKLYISILAVIFSFNIASSQNLDVGISAILDPAPGASVSSTFIDTIWFLMQNYGDTIPIGTDIFFGVTVDGALLPVGYTLTLTVDFPPNVAASVGGVVDLASQNLAAGVHTICVSTANLTDTDPTNDSSCVNYNITTTTTALSVTATSVNVSPGNCDGTATATASGGTTPYTYAWPDGQSTAIATGLCTGSYTVTVTDNAGNTATATATVFDPTGIADINSANAVNFFPNPASDIVQIRNARELLSLSVSDLSGRLVKTINVDQHQDQEFSVANLPQGVYLMIWTTSAGQHSKKLVVE
ncbi:MAG: T9SS type A sorting domain-containing protein [Flavobacteriales bacterium]|nr:T9SS type A sorting domain-containing protein [Flavobacteriales bacterium]